MRNRFVFAMAAVAIAAATLAPAQTQSTHPAEALDQAWTKAAMAGDVAALTALYAPDAVLYPPGSMEIRGLDGIRKEWEGMLNAFTISDAKIVGTYETVGDLSVGWARFSMMATPKAGGPPQKWEGRASVVAKRINGKWLYVSDHASMPTPPPPPPK